MNKLYEFRHNWYKGIDFDEEANLLRKQLNSAKKENDIQKYIRQ